MALNLTFGKKKPGKLSEGVEPPKPEKAKKAAPKLSLPTGGGKKNCFVMLMGDEGAILTFIQNGTVVRRLFAPSAERDHIKPFIELLGAHPNVPIYLLCDMIDQSYVRHSLPPVSPLSINKLVNRRLERDFAPEDIKGALSLGREKTGRKEWSFMLISLANSDSLQQWLEPVLEMPNQCLGVYLLPVESQEFIRQLSEKITGQTEGKESEWKILVAHDKVGGFRQVVLKDGQLIFTRLTQYSSNTEPDVAAGNVEQEVQNTIEYLRRLSFSEQGGLDIFMVMAQEIKDRIDVAKLGATRVNIFTPFEVSQVLGLPQAALSGDRFADVVLSANLGLNQKPKLKLLPAYAKKLDLMYKAKLGLRGVGVLAACYLLFSLVNGLLAWQGTSAKVKVLEGDLLKAQRELGDVQTRFNALGTDQNLVMRVASLYRATPVAKNGPLDFVRNFGAIKGDNVQVIDWSWNANYRGQSAVSSASPQPARGNARARQARPAQQRANTPPPVTYSINLRVEILEHGGDKVRLVKDAEALLGKMRETFKNYDITHSALPQTEVQRDELVIDFDAPEEEVDLKVQPGDEVVTITLSGPVDRPEGQES